MTDEDRDRIVLQLIETLGTVVSNVERLARELAKLREAERCIEGCDQPAGIHGLCEVHLRGGWPQ
jgi:hypothetical protein